MEASKLPAVVVTKILSALNWIDKLNTVQAIIPWQLYLKTSYSWPNLTFNPKKNKVWMGNKEIDETLMNLFLFCIEKYGKYVKHLKVEIFQEEAWHFWEFQLFEAVLKHCTNIRSFSVSNLTVSDALFHPLHEHYQWSPHLINAYIDILKKTHLKDVHLLAPRINWDNPEANVIQAIINGNLQNKFTNMELWSQSLEGNIGVMNWLSEFKRLQRLVIHRYCINNKIILELVANNLTELELFRTEENITVDTNKFTEDFWKRIVKMSPKFRIDLTLFYVVVLKESFPAYMPLRKLKLDGLLNSFTKGLIDEIITKYHATLQSFCCENSSLTDISDRRIEIAIVDLVKNCENLQEFEYGFSLSSSTVLLIAKARKLQKLKISRVEVCYDFDDLNRQNHTEDMFCWLKECGRNEELLEKSVSDLYGFNWSLSERTENSSGI